MMKLVTKLMLVMLIVLLAPQLALSQIADSFQNPLEGGWPRNNITQGFGRASDDPLLKTDSGWWGDFKGYHLAYDIVTRYTNDDLKLKRYKKVYAPANGYVRFAEAVVGYTVVIEHELPAGDPDGRFVCSVFYHMLQPGDGGVKLRLGQYVSIGETIGYVSPHNKDHGGTPHQHYGIRKGSFKSGTDSRTEKWFYPGYTTIFRKNVRQNNPKDPIHRQIISEWFNPYEFLARHPQKPPALGQVSAIATLNGSPWSGSINYNIVGPSRVIIGNAVPGSTGNLPPGQYTIYFNSGGPSNSYLAGITSSQSQSLGKGSSITFTLNFSSRGGSVPIIAWEFNSSGNFEGWRAFNISGANVSSGLFLIDPAGLDPYITSPSINVSADTYRYVQMRLASNAMDRYGNIYFTTRSENYYSPDKRVEFSVSNCPPSSCGGNAPFYTRSIYVGGHSKWRGTITGIRIDPANNGLSGTNRDTIGFDYVRLSNTQ